MAAPTFNYVPWQGSGGLSVTPRVFTSKLGDGYQQRSQAGLVANDTKYKFLAKDADVSEIADMITFLEDLAAVRPFYWTAPNAAGPLLWIQDGEYSVQNEKATSADFSVTFMRWHGAEE